MGKFLSKEITFAIDVSGNNNYVLMVNGVPINLSLILQNITQCNSQANRKTMIRDTIVAMIVTMVLTILIMMILISYLIKCYRPLWEGLIQTIIEQHRYQETTISRNKQ